MPEGHSDGVLEGFRLFRGAAASGSTGVKRGGGTVKGLRAKLRNLEFLLRVQGSQG